MIEFPSTPWRAAPWQPAEAVAVAARRIAGTGWAMLPGGVRHTFTHFHLRPATCCVGRARRRRGSEDGRGGRWCAPADFARLALPTLMKKVVRLVAAPASGRRCRL